jgi:hypothetical protein
MTMDWHLAGNQRHAFRSARLADEIIAESRPGSLMDRDATAQIRESKRRLAIAAIGGTDEREKGVILRNREQLTVAQRPASRSEVAGKHPDFSNKGLAHK